MARKRRVRLARVASKKAVAAAPKKKRVTKKAVTAAPKKKRVKKAVTAAPKKKRVKKRKVSAAQRLREEKRKLDAQVQAIAEAQQEVRGEPRRSEGRKRIKRRQKELEERRAERAPAAQELPIGTRSEEEASREENFARMRRRFRQLLEHARRTSQLPSSRRARGFYEGRWSRGEERVVRFALLLVEDVIEEVLYRVDQVARWMPGLYSVWYADVSISALGERLVGSRPRLLDLPGDPDAMFFQTEGYDNTGIYNTYQGMRQRLERLLEDLASSPRTVVYLHAVRILNFDRLRTS